VVAGIVAAGGRAKAYRSDAADAAAPGRVVTQVVADFGRLDILVANAGVFLGGPLEELTLDAYEQTMAVNVRGVFLAAQAAAGVMPRGGRLIGIGSSAPAWPSACRGRAWRSIRPARRRWSDCSRGSPAISAPVASPPTWFIPGRPIPT
jgi:NAD(P)-dependent dehydrogenase (short-subunit alcohol dehydrogenase family)